MNEYFQNISPELSIILAELQHQFGEDWPRKALERMMILHGQKKWTAKEFQEFQLLRAWALETLRAGIRFKEMLLTVPS